MAESEGFEPPEDFSSTVFKTAAFDHSASSPEIDFSLFHQLKPALTAKWNSRRIINICRLESS
jgi:hypothetical protein